MTALRDTGRAKLNLTLEVLGRRADGFHELKSLVAFPTFGDGVELEPQDVLELEVDGPFAQAVGGDNLIIKAARAALDTVPGLTLGRFRLIKNLPVAAGLGGGSADAAAALRLIAGANPGALADQTMTAIAARLGSDVTACLASHPALMSGRGERVALVTGFPSCGVLLANPGQALATEAVYALLRAEPLDQARRAITDRLDFQGSFEALLAYAARRDNDLERPAAQLVPEIREVFAALLALDGARLARLSGSGPTCFALFAKEEAAQRAGERLAAEFPNWWIAAATLGA
jgi:4-diphosphocytidyl-2-C-methyl-D-erythritol kinase